MTTRFSTDGPVGILTAIDDELRPLARRAGARTPRATGEATTGALAGVPVRLAASGMGQERSRAAAEALLAGGARVLIITGYCAGIAPDLRPGDLVVAAEVRPPDGGAPIRPPLAPHLGPIALGREHRGPLLSGTEVVTLAASKRALARSHPDALALDTETLGAGLAARAAGVPWCAVRAVTDGPGDTLPSFVARFALPNGQPDRARIVAAALTHPWSLPALAALGARSARAADRIGVAAEAIVASWAATKSERDHR